MRYYRYSRWDGTQQIEPFDPEELLEQLSDDLLADGDLRSGLQRLMQMGHRSPSGDRMMGLQQLLERLRQQQLSRFQLNDVMKEIQEKLDEVLRTERAGIDRRLAEARQRAEGGQQSQPDQAGEQGEQGPDGDRAPSGQQTRQGQQAPGSRGQRGQRGQQGQQGGQRQPGGQAQAGSEGQPGGEQDGGLDAETLRRMLEN